MEDKSISIVSSLFIVFLVVLALVAPVNTVYAETALTAGDVVIVGFNSDDPDQFAFVLLKDVDAGTQINFTDNGWSSVNNAFRTNEGVITWTASAGGVLSGTIINFTSPASGDFAQTSGDFSLSAEGDQILVYQGTASSPTFLFAINFEGSDWQSDADSPQTSALPPGLTNGTNAVAIAEIDNAVFTGPQGIPSPGNGQGYANAAALLAAVTNQANWSGSNTTRQAMPSGGYFTPNAITLRSFSADSISLSAGTLILPLLSLLAIGGLAVWRRRG